MKTSRTAYVVACMVMAVIVCANYAAAESNDGGVDAELTSCFNICMDDCQKNVIVCNAECRVQCAPERRHPPSAAALHRPLPPAHAP